MTARWHGLRGGDEEPDERRRDTPPATLRHVLGELTGRRGWQKRLEGARIHDAWVEIAGEQLAQHTEPVRLHGGVLVLRAESAAWATQVRFLTAELVRRADAVLGAGQVRQVTVVTGPLESAASPANRPSDPPFLPTSDSSSTGGEK